MPDTKNTPNTNKLAIHANVFSNIFQLNDPSIFERVTDEESLPEHIANMQFVMNKMSSKTLATFIDSQNVSTPELLICSSENGSVISVAKYDHTASSGEVQKYVTITMSRTIDAGKIAASEEERFYTEVFFTCSGILHDDGTIFMKESFARYPDMDDEPLIAQAVNQHDFYATMLYADAFFLALLRGDTPDVDDLSQYVADDQIPKAIEQYSNIISRTKYDLHLLLKGSTLQNDYEDDLHIMPISDVLKIFQLENTEIYDAVVPEDLDDIRNCVVECLEVAKSEYADHFREDIEFSDDPILFIQNDSGDIFFSVPYIKTDFFGIPQNYHMIICAGNQTTPSNDHQPPTSNLSLLSVIVGKMDYNTGEYEPLEAICKVKGSGKPCYISIKSPTGFLTAQCYAEAAMEDILIGNPLNYEELGEWLLSKNVGKALTRYEYLINRTSSGFMREIDDHKNGLYIPQQTETEIAIPPKYQLH